MRAVTWCQATVPEYFSEVSNDQVVNTLEPSFYTGIIRKQLFLDPLEAYIPENGAEVRHDRWFAVVG